MHALVVPGAPSLAVPACPSPPPAPGLGRPPAGPSRRGAHAGESYGAQRFDLPRPSRPRQPAPGLPVNHLEKDYRL